MKMHDLSKLYETGSLLNLFLPHLEDQDLKMYLTTDTKIIVFTLTW